MATIIKLKQPAKCTDCGAELVVGEAVRYYGPGRIYGRDCHAKPTVLPKTRRVSSDVGYEEACERAVNGHK